VELRRASAVHVSCAAGLETDKPENVVFYRRHGFDAVEELETHGLTTWFMRRDPR
jgi:hypothetical protein